MKHNETITYYQSTINSPIFSTLSEAAQNEIREKLQVELEKQKAAEKQEIMKSITDFMRELLKDSDIELSLLVTHDADKNIAVKEYFPHIEEETVEEDDEYVIESSNIDMPDMFEAVELHEEEPAERKKRKTEGFSVYFPEDGTRICEHDAVDTFVNALKKIGLARVAEVGIKHVGYNLVSITERPYEGRKKNPWQNKVDGLYIYKNIGNDVKIADLKEISDYYSLHLKIESVGLKHVESAAESEKAPTLFTDTTESVEEQPIDKTLTIKEQVKQFMLRHVAERTASSYISTLDNAIRRFINEKIDSTADSIFSYTTAEEAKEVIDLLNLDEEFIAENESRHHSLSAALKMYLKFVKGE